MPPHPHISQQSRGRWRGCRNHSQQSFPSRPDPDGRRPSHLLWGKSLTLWGCILPGALSWLPRAARALRVPTTWIRDCSAQHLGTVRFCTTLLHGISCGNSTMGIVCCDHLPSPVQMRFWRFQHWEGTGRGGGGAKDFPLPLSWHGGQRHWQHRSCKASASPEISHTPTSAGCKYGRGPLCGPRAYLSGYAEGEQAFLTSGRVCGVTTDNACTQEGTKCPPLQCHIQGVGTGEKAPSSPLAPRPGDGIRLELSSENPKLGGCQLGRTPSSLF